MQERPVLQIPHGEVRCSAQRQVATTMRPHNGAGRVAAKVQEQLDENNFEGKQATVALAKLCELTSGKTPFFLAVGYIRPHHSREPALPRLHDMVPRKR